MTSWRRIWLPATLTVCGVLVLGGCATKKYVRGEVEASESRTSEGMGEMGDDLDRIESQVEETQSRLARQVANALHQRRREADVVLGGDKAPAVVVQSKLRVGVLRQQAAQHLAGLLPREPGFSVAERELRRHVVTLSTSCR